MNARNQSQQRAAGHITQAQAQHLLTVARAALSTLDDLMLFDRDPDQVPPAVVRGWLAAAIADIEGTND